MVLVSLKKEHPKVSFLLGLVTVIRWSKEERAFVVEAHLSNGRSIIATQRVFRTRFNIHTGAPLPCRQLTALWVNTFRVGDNVKKKHKRPAKSVRSPRRSASKHAAALGISDHTVS